MPEIIYLLDGAVVPVLALLLLSECFAARRHDRFLQSLRANVPTVDLDFDTAEKAAGEFDPTVVRESREAARDAANRPVYVSHARGSRPLALGRSRAPVTPEELPPRGVAFQARS